MTVILQSQDKIYSTHSELGGLYCMIRITSIISNYYDTTTGSITVGSGSDAALDNTVFSDFMDNTNLVKGKHLDMVNSLRVLIQTSEFKTDGIRIKGHLDKNVPIRFLS